MPHNSLVESVNRALVVDDFTYTAKGYWTQDPKKTPHCS